MKSVLKKKSYKIFEENKISFFLHESKNLISIIQGYAEILQYFNDKISKKKEIEILQKIYFASFRLKNIFCIFFNIEKALKNFSFCNIEKIIFDAKDLIFIQNLKANIFIKAPKKSLYVFGNKDLLIFAIKNLMENSIKYSKNIANIFIDIKMEKKFINIFIKDDGIGILKEDLKKIFTKFFTRGKGSGIGLFLVKEILNLHMARIKILNSKKGSLFQIIFKNKKIQ